MKRASRRAWRAAAGAALGLALAPSLLAALAPAARGSGLAGTAVTAPADGAGAVIPAMPRLIAGNQRFHESPDWGLLGSLARCATAVGPGAALALASPTGEVASYLPSAGQLSAVVLARCPLTVVDLGTVSTKNQTLMAERSRLSALDSSLARLAARLARGTLLLVTSPGTMAGGRPHLASVLVSGPGFAAGLLGSASTRQPGIVTLTDLTPTVAGWLGRPVPAGTVGARIYRGSRGALTLTGLIGRDAAEQVWLATHGWFLAGYALADAVAFAAPGLLFWGSAPERRRRRARCWRLAGTLAAAVPLGSYLANLAPWGQLAPRGLVVVRVGGGLVAAAGRCGAGRPVAAERARPVRRPRPGYRGGPGRGRDDRVPAAARGSLRALAAGVGPVLRDRQRRARRLLRERPGGRGLGRPPRRHPAGAPVPG